ncbi:MAG TPA: hypothetical protein VM093_01055 [Aeromicrobium sp.]|nr:hypothetical protein [Aeromicrobium sp.]
MASVHKRPLARGGSAWVVRYRDPNNRPRERTFRTAADARAFAKTVDADVVRGDFVNPTLGRHASPTGRISGSPRPPA